MGVCFGAHGGEVQCHRPQCFFSSERVCLKVKVRGGKNEKGGKNREITSRGKGG